MSNPILQEIGTLKPAAVQPVEAQVQPTFSDEYEYYLRARWEANHPYQTPEEGELEAYNYTMPYDPTWSEQEF